MKFGAFFVSIFQDIFAFFAARFARQTAITLTASTLLFTLTSAFYVAITGLLAGLAAAIPNSVVLMYFYVLWPSNATTCFSVIFAAEIGAYLYRYKVGIVRQFMNKD